MVDEVARLFSEIQQIKAQYVAEVGRGRRVWPRSIKERIAKLDELGLPPKAIAEKTEVPYDTIILWRYKRRTSGPAVFHELSVGRVASLPIISKSATVTVPTKEMSLEGNPAPLRLTTPDGFVIEGFSEAAVIAFIARIRASGGGHAS